MLTKRGDVFVADLREYGCGRISLKTKDKRVAVEKHAELELKASRGLLKQEDKAPTLGEMYRRCHRETDWADAKDKRGIASRWSKLMEYFSDTDLITSVNRTRMSMFIGWWREADPKISPKTINKHLALLSKVLRFAAEVEVIDGMPAIPWLDTPKGGRIRWYTAAEEVAILTHFRDTGDFAMASLTAYLLDTGWRISEALSEFSVIEGKAYLWDQKGGKGMATGTPLTPRALQCATTRYWKGLSQDTVNKRWAVMRKALKLDMQANVHACRHTTASRLARAGRPVREIQEFMRHADVRTTMIYVHLAAGDLAQSAAVLAHCDTVDLSPEFSEE